MTGRPPAAFKVEHADLSGAPGVVIHGEVDVSTVPALVDALDTAIRESAGAFVVDLCSVEFLDSSGLSALMRARALLGRDERALRSPSSARPVPCGGCSRSPASPTCSSSTTRASRRRLRWCRPPDAPPARLDWRA